MSRGTVRIAMLLVSALYVSAMRQPLAVRQLGQVDPTTLVSTVPPEVVETVPDANTVVAQGAVTGLEPATVPVEVVPLPVDNTLLAPVEVLPVDSLSTGEVASVSTQAVSTATAVTAFAGNTLGIGFSGSGFLVSQGAGG
jgi:hypothetical protein